MRKHLTSVINIPDDVLIENMKFFGERCKMIVEPTGALGLGGIKNLVKQGVIKPGQKIGCVITGGNIDIERYTKLLTGGGLQYGANQMAALKENLTNKVKNAIGLSRALNVSSPKKESKHEVSTTASSVSGSGTDTPVDSEKPTKPQFTIQIAGSLK